MENFSIHVDVSQKDVDNSTWSGWLSATAGKLFGGQNVVQLKASEGLSEVFSKTLEDTVQVSKEAQFDKMMNNHEFIPISTKIIKNKAEAGKLKYNEVVFVKTSELAKFELQTNNSLQRIIESTTTPTDLKILQVQNKVSSLLSVKTFFDTIRNSLVDKWSQPVEISTINNTEQFLKSIPKVKLTSEQRENLIPVRTGGSETIASNPQKKQDWKNAENFIHGLAEAGTPLSFENLFKVNRLINGDDNEELGGGQLRDHPVQAGGRAGPSYPSENHIEKLVQDLINNINDDCEQNVNPIISAAGAYQKLVSIHPFADGNGRTCRLIMDYVLLRAGLPPPSLQGEEINLALFGKQNCQFHPKEESTTSAVEAVLAGVQRTYESISTHSSRKLES